MIKFVPYSEIQELGENISGKAKIKMIALKIHVDETEYQENGITWVKKYIEDNIQSAKNMHYVVSWHDEQEQIPYNHGEQLTNDKGDLEFLDSFVVGNSVDAYITEIEIDGGIVLVLMTEGYINTQRYNKFYHWLKKEIKNESVFGSIEIRGKENKAIIYENDIGYDENNEPIVGRKPMIFDFSDLAILYLTTPADNYCRVVEINNKEPKNKEDSELTENKYNNENAIVELNTQINSLNKNLSKLEKEKLELISEVNNLKSDMVTKETSITELNNKLTYNATVIIELNQEVVDAKSKIEELDTSNDSLKKYKLEQEINNAKAEVEDYFKTSICRNGFTDEELKSLRETYIDIDTPELDSLKQAESELIVQKYKALQEKNAEEDDEEQSIEVNNLINPMFIPSSKKRKVSVPNCNTCTWN